MYASNCNVKRGNVQKNTVRIEGDVAHMLINRRDGSNFETCFDATDLPRIQSVPRRWYAFYNKTKHGFYILSSDGHRKARTYFYLHRLIMDAPEDMQVDHIDGNTLNNRRSNLRIVTCSGNAQNRYSADPRSKTGVRNVSFCKSRNKYNVYLRVNGRRKFFGQFAVLSDAAEAAKEARRKYYPFSESDRIAEVAK